MKPEEVASQAQKLKGRKAKVKALDEEPSGTKPRKLPKDVQSGLEEALGTKLGKMRIHTGGNAGDIAKSLSAKAFTIGNDVYFGKPGHAKDESMVVHEIVHVVQASGGRLPKPQKGKALTTK